MNPHPVNAGIRLSTMLLDHIFMTLIAMIFYVPVMIANLATGFRLDHDQDDADFMSGPMVYVGLFGFALYFCKDMFNGRSISKRILKLQLVDNKTGEVASPLQCLVRNLFCIIWRRYSLRSNSIKQITQRHPTTWPKAKHLNY
jgi:uncharacterized RDD family membrane protein YckC